MRPLLSCKSFLVAVVAVLLATLGACSQPGSNDEVSFAREIKPIFNDKCVNCHGGIASKSGLNLIFEESATGEAESGLIPVIAGDPDASELIKRIAHTDPDERMPPEGDPLTDPEINTIRKWIQQGANWERHWAYDPPEVVDVPSGGSDFARSAIDRFILAKMSDVGLDPEPDANCPVLVRRVSLDLTGLPADASRIGSLCDDFTDDAYASLVDSLLASDAFGERWAAFWLDLARYANTKGYEKDGHRSIWRYRDWVIDAFNADMPFDEFTIEQLAGDLLPDATDHQILATAFHRNTMTNDEGGTPDEEYRTEAVIDRVNTTWEVWQGTAMACVQCHGHPYDPIRHEEYYSFFDYLNQTQDADRPDEFPTLSTYEGEERQKLERFLLEIAAETSATDTVAALLAAGEHKELANQARSWSGVFVGTSPSGLQDSIEVIEKVFTPIMSQLPENLRRTTRLLDRGSWLSPSDTVSAGIPAVLGDASPSDRLEMARWLVGPDNPLTGRVIVNRFWQQIFGIGIVESLEDFGSRGIPPSHPELLDWLAVEFTGEMDWSVKALLRTIVMSSTYRQDANVSKEKYEKDPRNLMLARGSRVRLSAEQVRDQALAVSGLLSRKMGGPSVMPPQPDGIWRSPYSGAKWIESEGEDRYRRGVYTYWKRTSPYPAMVSFDSPSREVCVSRRVLTNTPLQALITLNDPVFTEAADALAVRMLDAGDSVESQIRFGYETALARQPADATIEVLTSLYHDARGVDGTPVRTISNSPKEKSDQKSLSVVASAILNLDAFIMKE